MQQSPGSTHARQWSMKSSTCLSCWDGMHPAAGRIGFVPLRFRTFGHTDHRHTLATPREHASTLGILAGAAVHFNFRGKRLYGIVNRVTRRATVLVPDPDGERFSDGQTYLRYYVPLQSLELVASNAG